MEMSYLKGDKKGERNSSKMSQMKELYCWPTF